MSDPGPFGGAGRGPFEEIVRNLAKLFSAPGPVNWEVAAQLAQWSSTGGAPEPNVEPLSRVRTEELLRVAELHVEQLTGYSAGSGTTSLAAVTRSEWARRSLDAWRPLFERLATAAAGALPGPPELPPGGGSSPGDAMAQLFGNLPQMLGPLLFGMQAGGMVGQLAERAMGEYDLPMPRPLSRDLALVPRNVDGFAEEWGLDPDEVRLWVCLREVAYHVVLGRPHVAQRLDQLISEYVGAFRPETGALEERLSALDPTDLASMQSAFGDPAGLLDEMQSDEQRRLQVPLQALLAVVTGYVDHVLDTVGRRLIEGYEPITEALRRRRLEDHGGSRALGRLFGVELGAEGYERGATFVRGVIERAGEDALARLWGTPSELPTPAEVDAPGLWLARIDLPTGDD